MDINSLKSEEKKEVLPDFNKLTENSDFKFLGNYTLLQKFFAEFIGTALLVFAACGIPVFTKGDIVPSTLGGSFIVTILVFIFGKISGAQFNPAVTISFYMRKYINRIEFIIFILAQICGAFLGTILIGLVRKGKFDSLAGTKINNYLIHLDGRASNEPDAWCYISCFLCEAFLTFILVILVISITQKNTGFEFLNGIIIGLTLMTIIFVGYNISGSSFNPVRSIAPATLQAIFGGEKEPLKQIWIYIFAPITGAVIATYVGNFFFN